MLLLCFWVALWIGGWAWADLLVTVHALVLPLIISYFTCWLIVIVCPFAIFGMLIGRVRDGIIFGASTAVVSGLFLYAIVDQVR
jgi:hypothetical protein